MELRKINQEIKCNQQHQINISKKELSSLIIDGINTVYDINYKEYYKETHHAICISSGASQRVISFSELILNKFKKMGEEIPFDQREYFWNCICEELTEKMLHFIDEFKNVKQGLDYAKPSIEQHIRNACHMNAIFG